MSAKYTMTISRLTVDKLGVKLYDRVSAVIAELVANSYDADATNVMIRAPMGELLANKSQGVLTDRGFTIDVSDDRVKVIKTVETYKDDPATLESAFQKLIAAAPWLVNPQWSPLTSNQSFETLKEEFKKFYKKETGEDLELDSFASSEKRADFVMSNQDKSIEIVEIKRPAHSLANEEMVRINKYVELMEQFLNEPGNQEFKELFPIFRVTVVCDKIGLTGVHKSAFKGLEDRKILEHINWRTFLLRTRKMHEAFLQEAERQKKLAIKQP